MKIDAIAGSVPKFSVDASALENVKVESTKVDNTKVEIDIEPMPGRGRSFSELSQKSENELSIDESIWLDIVGRANKAITGTNCSFEYSIHESTKKIMVKVVDKETKDIVREIPPEKILDMVARLWEIAGILVDERR